MHQAPGREIEEVERWIFCFRQVGTKDLSPADIAEFQERSKRNWRKTAMLGLAAVFSAFVGILGIAIAAGSSDWGWAMIGFGLIGLFWSLTRASDAEKLARLCRRVCRVGKVDVFERTDPNPDVRKVWSDLEFPPIYSGGSYWNSEEKFLEVLQRTVGKPPQRIETPAGDDVICRIEDRCADRLMEFTSIRLTKGQVEGKQESEE